VTPSQIGRRLNELERRLDPSPHPSVALAETPERLMPWISWISTDDLLWLEQVARAAPDQEGPLVLTDEDEKSLARDPRGC
jgi:hypothetical protein